MLHARTAALTAALTAARSVAQDLTGSFTGGINEDVVLTGVDEPELVELRATGMAASLPTDALSAGQASTVFLLPPLPAYSIVFVPAEELG